MGDRPVTHRPPGVGGGVPTAACRGEPLPGTHCGFVGGGDHNPNSLTASVTLGGMGAESGPLPGPHSLIAGAASTALGLTQAKSPLGEGHLSVSLKFSLPPGWGYGDTAHRLSREPCPSVFTGR